MILGILCMKRRNEIMLTLAMVYEAQRALTWLARITPLTPAPVIG